jgi:hypothetical protein
MENNKQESTEKTANGVAGVRVITVGPQVVELLKSDSGFGERADIILQCADLDEWLALPAEEHCADLIILQCATVFPDTIDLITSRTAAAGAARAIVVYHFTQQKTAAMMEKHSNKLTALRSPVTAADLKSVCEADLAMAEIRNMSLNELAEQHTVEPLLQHDAEEISSRQFSDALLAKVSRISTSIECECPHHLASLLLALNAFELYCLQCANRDEKDAMLHALLHRKTASARLIMENALSTLAEAEGFELS